MSEGGELLLYGMEILGEILKGVCHYLNWVFYCLKNRRKKVERKNAQKYSNVENLLFLSGIHSFLFIAASCYICMCASASHCLMVLKKI